MAQIFIWFLHSHKSTTTAPNLDLQLCQIFLFPTATPCPSPSIIQPLYSSFSHSSFCFAFFLTFIFIPLPYAHISDQHHLTLISVGFHSLSLLSPFSILSTPLLSFAAEFFKLRWTFYEMAKTFFSAPICLICCCLACLPPTPLHANISSYMCMRMTINNTCNANLIRHKKAVGRRSACTS